MTIPIPHTAAGLNGAGTDVKLSPSAAAHVRSHTNGQSGRQEFFIQFGSDATKTAMVRIGDNGTVARKVAAALNGFDSPVAIDRSPAPAPMRFINRSNPPAFVRTADLRHCPIPPPGSFRGVDG